jgi:signal transduction histidine kinase
MLCVIINTLLIVQCTVTASVIFVKARKTAELYSLMVCNILMILWLFFAMVEKMSANIGQVYVVMRFLGFPVMFIGAAWLIFSLFYAGLLKPGNRLKIIALILAPPVLCYWPLLTESYRHLIIVSKTFGENKDVWGVLFYVNLAFTYAYAFTGVVLLNRKLKKQFGRSGRRFWLLIAVLIPVAVNVLNQFNILGQYGFDVLPMSFSIFSVILSIYIFRYRFLEVVPIASYELFSSLSEAVLITDSSGTILDCNAAAARYFGGLFDIGQCLSIQAFLQKLGGYTENRPSLDKVAACAQSPEQACFEETVRVRDASGAERQYTASIQNLKSSGKKTIGKLVTFRDVTEYRLLTLESERHRLSADLHDSLGNCINVISSNLEYALKNFRDSEDIKECLRISYEKTTGAFLNLRRIVDELRPVDIENNGLIWALESLFYKLRIKDITIEFTHINVDDKLLSGKKHGETIYFICQEAINNSVTHGRAKNITVTLVHTGGRLKLYVSDDGAGCEEIVRNKGLNSMAARVAALGGQFEYGAPSDGGFNIKAVFPL